MFVSLATKLAERQIELKHIVENLVDLTQSENIDQNDNEAQIPCDDISLIVVSTVFSGETTRVKLRK